MIDTEPPATSAGGRRGGKTQARFSSVSGHFCTQLGALTDTLQSTSSHFVRCINPNKKKTPDCFVGGEVLHQLRCSGMMEALRLMHAGFPTRCPYEDLYDRYKDMMPRSVAQLDSPSFCEILLMALGLEKSDYQLGITKVLPSLAHSSATGSHSSITLPCRTPRLCSLPPQHAVQRYTHAAPADLSQPSTLPAPIPHSLTYLTSTSHSHQLNHLLPRLPRPSTR